MRNIFSENKGEFVMSLIGIIIIIIGVFLILFGAYISKYGFNEVLKNITVIVGIANIILVCITAGSFYYAGKTNKRAEKLFIGNNQPLIDVSPIGIMQSSANNQVTTFFSISNYSGFEAKNIGIDLKYGDTWVLEWRKAENDRINKGDVIGIEKDKIYMTSPSMRIEKLKPGETYPLNNSQKTYGIIGSLNLDNVCESGELGLKVQVRATWQNKQNHIFDAVHQYKLVCTKVSEGRAFTFIPEGIISNKQK
ncbi:MAG: hypothetical protein JXB49_24525 [Bacteroidales bacterium]|nr:hypothetical protein [Bacteroidales bacterium]